MKKMLTATLMITLFGSLIFSEEEYINGVRIVNFGSRDDFAGAKSEVAKINDLATLEKIAADEDDPYLMRRFAIEKLNEMKKAGIIPETQPEQPEKSSFNKSLFGIFVVALLAIFGGVAVWRKKPPTTRTLS